MCVCECPLQDVTVTPSASLTFPPGHTVLFAVYDAALHGVLSVVNSAQGDAHILMLDDKLSNPPLMDAVAMPVRAGGTGIGCGLLLAGAFEVAPSPFDRACSVCCVHTFL